MAAVRRTRTLSYTRGFLKALIAADSDRLLGFTALGAEAGELIAVVQTAMLAGLPYTTPRDAMLTHPTIAEGLTVLFASEPGAARQVIEAEADMRGLSGKVGIARGTGVTVVKVFNTVFAVWQGAEGISVLRWRLSRSHETAASLRAPGRAGGCRPACQPSVSNIAPR